MIVDFDGRILAQADPGPGEKIVVGPIDLAALRHERQRRRGHHLLAQLRSEAYPAGRQAIYPVASDDGGERTSKTLEAAIRRGRENLSRVREERHD
jgi:hypothetical protein